MIQEQITLSNPCSEREKIKILFYFVVLFLDYIKVIAVISHANK